MPNYQPSDSSLAQVKLETEFKTAENRFINPITFNKFFEGSSLVASGLKEARTREDVNVTAYFPKKDSGSVGTGERIFNHTGGKGDSVAFTPTWLTRNTTFNISLKQGGNNEFSHEEMLMNEYRGKLRLFANAHEQTATDHLVNNRSQVSAAVSGGTFNVIKFAFEINESTNGDTAALITGSAMYENEYGEDLIMFCDTNAYNKFLKDNAQGISNQTNLSFQFGGKTIVHSVKMNAASVALAYNNGFWVTVERNMIGALDWIPRENIVGTGTSVDIYGTFANPVDKLLYAQHTYETRADDSANNGSKQDTVTQFELSVDFALEHAPLTAVDETVLQAFALV